MRIGHRSRIKGFSLVEVLVTLIVVSVGLLGLAKMESLALVSTNVAGTRSIAAIQASSLAAAMHANRGFWGKGTAPGSATVTATSAGVVTILPVSTGLGVAATCTTSGATACDVAHMAAYDVQQWAIAVAKLLPSYLATIQCNTANAPVNCTISITWVENAVAATSQQTATGLSALQKPVYTLYVEP